MDRDVRKTPSELGAFHKFPLDDAPDSCSARVFELTRTLCQIQHSKKIASHVADKPQPPSDPANR